MRRIENFYEAKVGDVVLVEVTFVDQHPHLPGTVERKWRRFALILERERTFRVGQKGTERVSRVAECLDLVNMGPPKIRTVWLSENCKVFLLDPSEHPEGTTALRMRAIMLGLVTVNN